MPTWGLGVRGKPGFREPVASAPCFSLNPSGELSWSWGLIVAKGTCFPPPQSFGGWEQLVKMKRLCKGCCLSFFPSLLLCLHHTHTGTHTHIYTYTHTQTYVHTHIDIYMYFFKIT